ncbi:MAG: DUF2516 family protein [Streptosporangiaceae bacterium]
MNFGAYGPLQFFFWALLVAAFVVEAWAFIDAIRRPGPAFVAASKQTKPLWLVILGVALIIGLGGAAGELSLFSILPIIAFVAAAIYLTDVRPKVSGFNNKGGTHQGPYGPW